MNTIYHEDLAYIHHAGFGDFAAGAAPGLLEILKHAGIQKGELLDLGCGSGIWAREAQRAGFPVIGIDSSPAMIRLARKVSPRSRFHCASLHSARFPRCNVVTAIGEGLNYVAGGRRNSLLNLFTKIFSALRPNGLLIFDVIIAEGTSLDQRVWKAGKDWAVLVNAKESKSRRRLTRQIISFRKAGKTYRRSDEVHDVLLFPQKSVERALGQAGFTVRLINAYGNQRLSSRRCAFICRKQTSR